MKRLHFKILFVILPINYRDSGVHVMDNNQQYAAVRLLDCLDVSLTEETLFPVFEDYGKDLCPEQFFRTNVGWNIYYADNQITDIRLHMHDYIELIYFPDTELEYLIESKIYRLNAGDILFIPNGFFHRPYNISPEATYSRVVLSISRDFLNGIHCSGVDLAECLGAVSDEQHFLLPCSSPDNKFIRLLLQQLVRISSMPFQGDQFLQETFCAQIVLYMLHSSHSASLPDGRATKNQLIRTTLDYISDHICEQITLESVAEQLFISKYHLSHGFKKHMGISLHQYIIMKRIEMAKAMITEGKPLNLVCVESGFNNYSNFFKAFKNIEGVPPSEYTSETGSL